MRLEKYLVLCGIGSRKTIKLAIQNGEIKVNNITVYSEAIQIDEKNDIISYKDKITTEKEYKYYIFHKASGYITATKDEKLKTIYDILPSYIDKNSIFPVGRLDKDTEGLLLLTNDGNLNYKLTHPKEKIEKIYYTELERPISNDDIEKLLSGVTLDTGYFTSAKNVEYISSNSINLTITEGKFHQVKKMIKAINNKVLYLKRIKFGNLELSNLPIGEVLEISKSDIVFGDD